VRTFRFTLPAYSLPCSTLSTLNSAGRSTGTGHGRPQQRRNVKELAPLTPSTDRACTEMLRRIGPH
jgi:hypothetical protein